MPIDTTPFPYRRSDAANNGLPDDMSFPAYMRSRSLLSSRPLLSQVGQKAWTPPPPTPSVGYDGPQLNPAGTMNGSQYSFDPKIGIGADTGATAGGPSNRLFSKQNVDQMINKGAAVANAVAPFASNIVNAFRKPPMPKRGVSDPYVTLNRVSLDNARTEVNRTFGAADRGADRSVDGNTAEAIKAFNRGQKLDQFSKLSENEANANADIGNKEAFANAQIQQGNNAKKDEYNTALTERAIAQQREQSANFANAGDKYTLIGNEQQKGRVELGKARVLAAGLYGRSGVLNRSRDEMRLSGVPDPLGLDYTDLPKKKAYGGSLSNMRRIC